MVSFSIMNIPSEKLRSSRGRERLATVLRSSKGFVTVDSTAEALSIDREQAAKLLARWRKQGWLKRLRRGLYVPIPIDAVSAERTLLNPWSLVPKVFDPGYVGGWSAAEHWDLTEQIFHEVCVFTTRPQRRRRQDLGEVAVMVFRLQSEHLIGTTAIWLGSVRVPVSDPHRTIIDMLSRPQVGGGIRHTADCLDAYLDSAGCDLETLVKYGDQLGNGAVFKRLGFLLERSRRPDAAALEACRARLTAGNARLDPALAADSLVKRWRLWVPKSWRKSARD
jgi:predicted transcriptional regulator of viral defense system